jgi:hypothetical protein
MTTTNVEESLGIFELDNDDRVIHSNFEGATGWLSSQDDLKGREFFDEVLGFTNVADLRVRLAQFRADSMPACSFDFVCRFQQHVVPIKVLLARLTEGNGDRSILIHLKRSQEFGAQAATEKPF